MRAEGGGQVQVQVPNDCYDLRCFAAMFFSIYLSQASGQRTRAFQDCVVSIMFPSCLILTESWTASYFLLARPLASKTSLFV